jgi:pyruvate dehydrogenase E2 component (dihydrolipoamide acetyltransferase)
MPIPVLMPALSPTMEEGRLAKWLVKAGDAVKPGKVIAEIETDKATMEVEAIDEGVVAEILVAAGTDKVRVNTPIAMLRMEGEAAYAPTAKPPTLAPTPFVAAPVVTPARAPVIAAAPPVAFSPPPPAFPAAPAPGGLHFNGNSVPAASHDSRRFISPLANRLAQDAGLDVAALKGSGPQGRIVQRDIEAARAGGVATQAPAQRMHSGIAPSVERSLPAVAPVTAATPSVSPPRPVSPPAVAPMADDKILALYDKAAYEVVPHDGMRRIIAERLTQSKSTVPHFYLSVDIRLDTLLAARERLNARSPKDGPRMYKLSVNDFVIKALALALMDVPGANATWTTEGMLRHRHADVGVAVAVDGGLFTPVIKHAELKTLAEISNEMKDMAERARKRRLAPHEYQGGTTSISNLGMFGIRSFDAVINPPHATILAVGAGEKRPVVVKDAIEVATMMTATLSCDHRVVDGALGAELLNAFKSFIEDPVRMLV